MKKMTFALACASTAALFADFTNAIGFEDYTAPFTGLSNKTDAGADATSAELSKWLYMGASGSEDGSTVKAYETGAAPTTGGETGNNYLELSTEGGTLWRSVNGLSSASELGAAQAVSDAGLYIDTMVQFTPTEDGGTPELDSADKLAIWLNVETVDNVQVTNLCVRAARVYRDGSEAVEAKTFVLKGATVEAGEWYRLKVKAIPDVTKAIADGERSTGVTGYQIYLGDTLLSTEDTVFDASYTDWAYDDWLEDDDLTLLQSKTVFAGLDGFVTTAQLTAVGFKGSGAIDNLGITETDPNPPAPAPADTYSFTITTATGVTAEYSTDGETWTAYAEGAKAPEGAIQIRLTTTDGGVKVVSKTVADEGENAFDLSAETFGWAEYLGAAVEGAYVIDDQAEFGKFVAKVATLGSEGITFKLAENLAIDLDGATCTPIGAGANKDNVSFDPAKIAKADCETKVANFKSTAFKGTFDGNGGSISNFKLVRQDYTGLFGSTYKATIKNLKVATLGFADGSTDCGGAVLVGTSVDTTIENCEASGTVTATKAIAGMVGYGCSGTVVKGCVNKANLTTANEKIGGMIGCAQNGGTGYWGDLGVVVDGCTNEGNLTCSTSGKTYLGGLVTYADSKVTLKGANVVKGTLTQNGGSVSSLVAPNSGSIVIEDGATFSVPAAYKTTIKSGKAVDGIFFATVADGVATLVKNSAAVAGANLKVMAPGAPTITLPNVGDSITLDETLATATVTTTDTEANEVVKADNVYTVQAKTVAVTGVTLDQTTAEITVGGETLTLTATVAPENATDKTVTWTSSDTTKATVANGVVTAVAAGEVTITATAGDKSATCVVTVKEAAKVYPAYIAEADKAKYDTWAETNKITDRTDSEAALKDAYLLNVAPAAVAAAKAEFKITSITVNADGSVTVTTPADKNYNGKVEIVGSATIDGEYTAAAVTAKTAKFVKAILK